MKMGVEEKQLVNIPKPVQAAIDEGRYIIWGWQSDSDRYRTVLSGYAMYAQTGCRNNGWPVARRIYFTCDYKRAEALVAALEKLLSSVDHVRLRREIKKIRIEHELF
jgi:hypothetical protein